MDKDNEKIFEELSELYSDMHDEYNKVASMIGLSCANCTDNCCISYFKHHTYLEWAYLWYGLQKQNKKKQEQVLTRAQEYVKKAQKDLSAGQRPAIMCPLNVNGLCTLYDYRLMICRLHGVPNKIYMPNGQLLEFPGCQVCTKITERLKSIPVLDRTNLYMRLAELENRFLDYHRKKLPKVKLTIAEMLVQGPPKI